MYNYPIKRITMINVEIHSKDSVVNCLITGKKDIEKVAKLLKTIKNAKD